MKIVLKIILAIAVLFFLLFIIGEVKIISQCKEMINSQAISATLSQCVKVYSTGGDYFRMTVAQ